MRNANDLHYETLDRPVKLRPCDHPACGQPGDFRAPKSRDQLNAYYFFCLDHVRDYNKAWDYFAGLSPDEVENYTRDAAVWERPSWPLGQWSIGERELRDKAMRDIFADASPREDRPKSAPPMSLPEREALATLKLIPPVDFAAIKAQYRVLVKLHHPDLRGGDKDSEEIFKDINQAFATLRKIYEGEQGG